MLALLVSGATTRPRCGGALGEAPEESFPRPVADALAALAAGDRTPTGTAVGARARVLRDAREAYLEDIPVADTVVVLEALAGRRGVAAGLRSPLLPDEAAG